MFTYCAADQSGTNHQAWALPMHKDTPEKVKSCKTGRISDVEDALLPGNINPTSNTLPIRHFPKEAAKHPISQCK